MDANKSQDYIDTDNSMHSFHLVLLTDADEMYEMWLPKISEGFFYFTDRPEYNFLSIIAKDGRWVAVCQKPAFFKEVPVLESYESFIYDGALLKISVDERSYILFAEKVQKERLVFHNYNIYPEIEITIGSHPDNDIYYKGPYVSRHHAVLRRQGGSWLLSCKDSIYGAYVNGEKKSYANLKLGDVVYLMGLRIIIGVSFFSINSGIGEVTVSTRIVEDVAGTINGGYRYYNQQQKDRDDQFFSRPPRKRAEIEDKIITIEGPPISMSNKQMPLLLRMGSSMVMGGAAALAGNFLTLISSVLFPFMSSKYTDKQREEYERLRTVKYTQYLAGKRNEIDEAIESERVALNVKYPLMSKLVAPVHLMTHLWERRPCDSDFLQLRLGRGTRKLSAQIDYPQKRFNLETDALEEEMFKLAQKQYYVDNVPIVLSLIDTYVCGITGERSQVLDFIHQLVLQISVFHSYDEVKMVFLLNKEDHKYLDGVQYLPHIWDDNCTIRFVATNESEAYLVGEYIKDITADEKEEKDISRILKKRPYFIIFAFDKKLFESHEIFKELLQSEFNRGVSVITAHDALPKETQKIISLDFTSNNIATTMGVDGGEDDAFISELVGNDKVKEVEHKLANTSLKMIVLSQSMPKMVTFLEMFKIGRIEQLNPLKRWADNNPVKSLATPVGVGSDKELFMLDLHEKRQGPHGLVAGMTGSGKSEFIITYILSMAVNYHPDEVAFVLIDYKGGGLAGAFENQQLGVKLPHIVGTITNLDGASIKRSLMSIESELLRRQRLFNETKSIVNEGTMDIYAYQKLYRAGKVSEPVPHLFIVSDEFAELKQQQPEFMDKLISTARIGRSLGVHLILATQKPSGVVNDQIRSNTKFRVCLRVQERSDSMDMLKRPEAAELTDTGRFYLQVGYNEYFALGQSAWSGAPYEPQDISTVRRDDTIEFLDTTGNVIASAKPKVRKTGSGMKQVVAVVKYLSDIAKAHNIESRQLWKPELPKKLDLDELSNNESCKEPMKVALGLLDDPKNQDQFTMSVDFKTCQNILIAGDSSSGKTTMVQNIIYSLAKQLSPQEFNFYALDYSSRMLKLFKPLAHCGAVLQEEDDAALDSFFTLINSIIAERKQLFSTLEVDNFEAALKYTKLPLVLVVIDNVSGLSSSKIGEAHSYRLQSYVKNSAVYGVKYIVTCNHLNEVPSRLRQELGSRICLHMKDRYDYGEVLNCKVTYVPPEISGRGLYKIDDVPLEMQSAIVCANGDEKERTQYIKDMVKSLCEKFGIQPGARLLPVVNDNAEYSQFADQFGVGRIPLGYSKTDGKPVALPLKQMSALSFYIGNCDGQLPIAENLIYVAKREQMELWVVKRAQKSLFDNTSDLSIDTELYSTADVYSCDTESVQMLKEKLMSTVAERLIFVKEFSKNQDGVEYFDYIRNRTSTVMIFFENYADFCSVLDDFSQGIFRKYFSIINKLNIYLVALFEPDDYKRASEKMLYTSFNAEKNIVLLGGNFSKQILCEVPEISSDKKEFAYNLGVMYYRKRYYPLLIPCGEINSVSKDSDMQSIF